MISPKSEDIARRAEQIYQERLKEELERTHRDEFLAIEPDSGDYFLGPTFSAASAAAHKVYPDRVAYVLRIGHPVALEIEGWEP
jgi:hypothetical protein